MPTQAAAAVPSLRQSPVPELTGDRRQAKTYSLRKLRAASGGPVCARSSASQYQQQYISVLWTRALSKTRLEALVMSHKTTWLKLGPQPEQAKLHHTCAQGSKAVQGVHSSSLDVLRREKEVPAKALSRIRIGTSKHTCQEESSSLCKAGRTCQRCQSECQGQQTSASKASYFTSRTTYIQIGLRNFTSCSGLCLTSSDPRCDDC